MTHTIKLLPYPNVIGAIRYEATIYDDAGIDVFGETIVEDCATAEEAKDRAALALAKRGIHSIAWQNCAGGMYEGRC